MLPRGARRAAACLALAAALGTIVPGSARGQEPPGASPGTGAAARSLLLPGWGQHHLGQRRAWAYALAEVALWTVFGERRHEGWARRDTYRDFAWETGRIRNGPRTDGAFAYYETLSTWLRSGAFDADGSAAGIQPEEDATTYNGSIWERARGLYLPAGAPPDPSSPAYQQALEYYRRHAYGSSFLWDWSGREGDQRTLGTLIRRSDDAFRQATTALGAVLANHVLSAVDAYVSGQLSRPARIRMLPPDGLRGRGWTVTLRLGGMP